MSTPPHWHVWAILNGPGLIGEICGNCGELVWPPRDVCSECHERIVPEGEPGLNQQIREGKISPPAFRRKEG